MKTKNKENCRTFNLDSTTAQPTSTSTCEVVGTKTHEELDNDWLTHFRENTKIGRPKGDGWLSTEEMVAMAGVKRGAIRRYVNANKELFDTEIGTETSDSGARRARFYRFKTCKK